MMDDMFSSTKGAGIIGMVLALIVFAAFIGLGVAVFDGRFNGDNGGSIESKLSQQEAEIAALNGRAGQLEVDLETKRKNSTLRTEADVIKERLQRLDDTQAEVEAELTEVKAKVESVQTGKNTYRQSYRDAVRAKAVGTVLGELKTADGRVYQSVKIKRVTALELSFMDETGPKGVPYKDLPPEMQDYYQFGEDEAATVRSERGRIEKRVTERLKTVDTQERDRKKDWEVRQASETIAKAKERIASLQSKIADAEDQIRRENRNADNARRQHDQARALGNTSAHLVKAKKAEEAAARWRTAIKEAQRLIEIERKKLR